jgi:hypothetical protein
MEELHRQLEISMKQRHNNEAAELNRLYDALRRLNRLEVRSLLQAQIQPQMRDAWFAHDGGDFDGEMTLGVELGRSRRQLDTDFDQLAELGRRKKLHSHSELVARHQQTLAYMRENGIDITDDPASKWLPLQRERAREEFRANSAEMTRHFDQRLLQGLLAEQLKTPLAW